ncbi:MAG: tetratricopeptide repeat protein, partial [Methanomicrobiales archaeon]|nr:tetratricopeptide repeat protein [Methanomicrobiales archaeon]
MNNHALLMLTILFLLFSITAVQAETAEEWYNKGLALNGQQQYEDAIEAFDNAIQINPNNATYWSGKGISFMFLEKYEDALLALDSSIVINPDDSGIWSLKGTILSKLGKFTESKEAFDIAAQLLVLADTDDSDEKTESVDSEKMNIRAKNLISPEKYETAEEWYNKGRALNGQQQYEDAIEAFDNAIQINPNNATYWNGKGISFMFLEKYEDALLALDSSIVINPDD